MTQNDLPGKELVLTACRGFPNFRNHPMLEAVGELAALHASREQTPASKLSGIDRHRAGLMHVIDLWVVLATPVPYPAAPVHPHTMGETIDQLAHLTWYTHTALAHAPERVFYESLVELTELGDAYQALADDLTHGIRQLPTTITTVW